MIRVVMFDLADTLIDSRRRPFPHVEIALAAISGFKTPGGKALQTCLVSDFTMPTPPVTAAKVRALFKDYLAILDGTGLRPLFEPVSKRITLSTHAGARKPDGNIFKKALQRLGAAAVPLTQCLLITENAAHIAKARSALKMKTLRFRRAGSSTFDFKDWADAPALVEKLIVPSQQANAIAAARAHLETKGIDLRSAGTADKSGAIEFSGWIWWPVPVQRLEGLKQIYVTFPIEGKITRGRKGEMRSAVPKKPSAGQIAEATSFVRSLVANDQIEGRTANPAKGATHRIETDKDGHRRLVRKSFSAK